MHQHYSFLKMHGCGNDFVVVDGRQKSFQPSAAQAQSIADRRKGIGFDQLIVLEPSSAADVFMRIYNADGSESGACGNATRCIADLVMSERQTASCSIETLPGVLLADRRGSEIKVNMGPIETSWDRIPLAEKIDTLALPIEVDGLSGPVATGVGNPHCSFLVDALSEEQRDRVGKQIEHHPLFPERTNVQLVQVLDRNTIEILIWERGVGPTLASGSSSCATATAAMRRGLCDRSVRVRMPGGSVTIDWLDDGTVDMTGPFAYVCSGTLRLDETGLVTSAP